MPAIVAWIIGGFWNLARKVLPGIVGRIMLALGLTVVTTTLVLPDVLAFVQSKLGGVGADVINALAFFNIDKVVTMMISAGVARTVSSAALGTRGSA